MSRYLVTYVATWITMVLIDLLWLGVIAKPLYQQGIGHLMAEKPNLVAAALFYLLYPVGIVMFAVTPDAVSASWIKTFTAGALLGLFAYATYDLTNLATLKGWPVSLALVDMAWGSLVTGLSALAGKSAFDRFTSAG